MAIYSASSISTLVPASANGVLCGFKGSTTRRVFVREIGMFYITAPTTSGAIGLQRSLAIGTGTITAVVGQGYDVNDPATTAQVETNWATALPTTSNNYFKRWSSAATIGNGMIWRFDEEQGLTVPLAAGANSELLICNLLGTAPGTLEFYFTWEE